MTVTELAKKSGVHYSQIYGYIRGHKKGKHPNLNTMLSLAQALHCTLEELTGLPALHDAKSKLPNLTPDAVRFGKFFESLLDGDPLKEYLRKMMESKGDSHDIGEGGAPEPK